MFLSLILDADSIPEFRGETDRGNHTADATGLRARLLKEQSNAAVNVNCNGPVVLRYICVRQFQKDRSASFYYG